VATGRQAPESAGFLDLILSLLAHRAWNPPASSSLA
jgi:hypothetical protein